MLRVHWLGYFLDGNYFKDNAGETTKRRRGVYIWAFLHTQTPSWTELNPWPYCIFFILSHCWCMVGNGEMLQKRLAFINELFTTLATTRTTFLSKANELWTIRNTSTSFFPLQWTAHNTSYNWIQPFFFFLCTLFTADIGTSKQSSV